MLIDRVEEVKFNFFNKKSIQSRMHFYIEKSLTSGTQTAGGHPGADRDV